MCTCTSRCKHGNSHLKLPPNWHTTSDRSWCEVITVAEEWYSLSVLHHSLKPNYRATHWSRTPVAKEYQFNPRIVQVKLSHGIRYHLTDGLEFVPALLQPGWKKCCHTMDYLDLTSLKTYWPAEQATLWVGGINVPLVLDNDSRLQV